MGIGQRGFGEMLVWRSKEREARRRLWVIVGIVVDIAVNIAVDIVVNIVVNIVVDIAVGIVGIEEKERWTWKR